MAKRTQKSGSTARFGARYGVSVRRRAGSALKKKSNTTPAQCAIIRRCVGRLQAFGSAESAITHSQGASGNHSRGPPIPITESSVDPWRVLRRPT